jgi:nicotinamidase-related amidase
MGLYDDLYPPIADRSTLVDGTAGTEIFPGLAPSPGEHIIKKHRYSAFFATDLVLILRDWGITTVIISGTTTENCCHATARDAMFNNTRLCSFRMRPDRSTTPTLAKGPCRRRRCIKLLCAFSRSPPLTS